MRKWLIALMVILSIALGAVVVGVRSVSDRKGPEIKFSETKDTTYTKDTTIENLLEGVIATDDRDGDVSYSLRVEGTYPKNDGEIIVTYVAKDTSNNVSKAQLIMQPSGNMADVTEEDTESEETADTDIEDTEAEDTEEDTEDAEAEPELTKEEEAKKTQEDKIEMLSPTAPRFYLTTYYLELPVGTPFDGLSYVADIQDDVDSTNDLYRRIQIDGEVNVSVPGTYELTYYVVDSNGNSSNGAVLTVVVL